MWLQCVCAEPLCMHSVHALAGAVLARLQHATSCSEHRQKMLWAPQHTVSSVASQRSAQNLHNVLCVGAGLRLQCTHRREIAGCAKLIVHVRVVASANDQIAAGSLGCTQDGHGEDLPGIPR